MTPEEIKKKEDEKQKIIDNETFETQNIARRKTYRMWIYGHNFIKTNNLYVKFTFNGGIAMKEVTGVYKNSEKIGVVLPDMGEEVPTGHHPLNVEISLNGQQYTN